MKIELELTGFSIEKAAEILEEVAEEQIFSRRTLLNQIADQLRAKSPIPEPGLWGVVEASVEGDETRRRFVRHADVDGFDWVEVGGSRIRAWGALIGPSLVHAGAS